MSGRRLVAIPLVPMCVLSAAIFQAGAMETCEKDRIPVAGALAHGPGESPSVSVPRRGSDQAACAGCIRPDSYLPMASQRQRSKPKGASRAAAASAGSSGNPRHTGRGGSRHEPVAEPGAPGTNPPGVNGNASQGRPLDGGARPEEERRMSLPIELEPYGMSVPVGLQAAPVGAAVRSAVCQGS